MFRSNLTYDCPVSTPTLYLVTAKLHCNILLSTLGSRYLILDEKNIYLNNTMNNKE